MDSQLDSLNGRELDGYLIEKLLGQGGMARVYRAQDVRLGRYVAIKVIEPVARFDPEYSRRFEKEARAVAQLQHPHIVNLYRFGEVDGLYYMAMQYIEGADLGWVLEDYANDQEFMPHDDVLRIVTQLASALDYAHSRGVIHRDFKPPNAMLNPEGNAVLTDFGLALVQAEGTRGEIFGTPKYIAPEQAVSSAGALPQSDQYSLGVMLYEMLTGSVPYSGDSPMDIALAHMSEPLPSPLERNPDLHPAVVAVLEKVLRKDPVDRYPTCKDLAVDLERALKAQAHKPSTAARMSMLNVTDQVQAFRAANPLPPLPAQVATPVASTAKPSTARENSPAKDEPGSTIRRQQTSRHVWMLVTAASALVVVVGLIAIALLINTRNTGAPLVEGVALTTESAGVVAAAESSTQESPATFTPPLLTTTPIPTETPTSTIGATATALPVIVPTEQPATISYAIVIRWLDEDSLFVTNISVSDFPLRPLTLSGDGQVEGAEWGVPLLTNGECVAVWKDTGNPQQADTSCEPVGAHLIRGGPERFWKSTFDVIYEGSRITTCASSPCLVQINK
jgi:serine/threonine protein kinase